jgi:hypothetical protein
MTKKVNLLLGRLYVSYLTRAIISYCYTYEGVSNKAIFIDQHLHSTTHNKMSITTVDSPSTNSDARISAHLLLAAFLLWTWE